MCKVLNKHKVGLPEGAVFIGRGSKWSNPFRIGYDGDRITVIDKYKRWIAHQSSLIADLEEIRGKDLICFCAPQVCHGDVLLWLAKVTVEQRKEWQKNFVEII